MKKHRGKPIYKITPDVIDSYAEEMTSIESEAVQYLINQSDAELRFVDMLSGRIVGKLLQIIIQISGAKRILEIGTFTGYSALMMSEVIPNDGQILTCEMNFKYMELAKSFFEKFDNQNKIKVIEGNALDSLNDLEGPFDLVYLDGDKLRYPLYYTKIKPMLRSGGLIIADNVLWDGMVLNPEDEKSIAIDEFNRLVAADSEVEQVLLPIRDGVNVIRKN